MNSSDGTLFDWHYATCFRCTAKWFTRLSPLACPRCGTTDFRSVREKAAVARERGSNEKAYRETMRTVEASSRWWTVRQLAEHYALSPRTIYDAIAKAELAVHRFGDRRAIRISDEDRLAWEKKSRSANQPSERLTVGSERPKKPQLVAKHFRR
jgi:hypothetical protein